MEPSNYKEITWSNIFSILLGMVVYVCFLMLFFVLPVYIEQIIKGKDYIANINTSLIIYILASMVVLFVVIKYNSLMKRKSIFLTEAIYSLIGLNLFTLFFIAILLMRG